MDITAPDCLQYLKNASTFWNEMFTGYFSVYINIYVGLKQSIGSKDQTVYVTFKQGRITIIASERKESRRSHVLYKEMQKTQLHLSLREGCLPGVFLATTRSTS